MAEICYYRAKKVILVPGQKENGKWVCEVRIPEFKEPEIGNYQGRPPGEYDTEHDATMAAFAYAKTILAPWMK